MTGTDKRKPTSPPHGGLDSKIHIQDSTELLQSLLEGQKAMKNEFLLFREEIRQRPKG